MKFAPIDHREAIANLQKYPEDSAIQANRKLVLHYIETGDFNDHDEYTWLCALCVYHFKVGTKYARDVEIKEGKYVLRNNTDTK